MGYKYEVNGQIVEFENEPTEKDIDEAAASLPPPASAQPVSPLENIPAAGSYIPGESGLPTVKEVVSPMYEAGKRTIQSYPVAPGKAVVDVGAVHFGLPPPYASYQAYQGAKDVGKAFFESANQAMTKFGTIPEAAAPHVNSFIESITQKDYQQLKDQLNKLESPAAKQQLIKKYKAPEYFNEAQKANLKTLQSQIPGTAQKVGNVAGAVARGASKVLAPIGATIEAVQGVNQARKGDYTGAGLSGLGVASFFNPMGLIAQPGISMMQGANQNFRQQTPSQQRESTMSALSGQTPGMYGGDFPQYETAIREKAAQKALGIK